MIVASWGAMTDCGRVRALNEDCLMAEPPLFVVADGMGGHAAGEVASRIAIDAFERLAALGSASVAEMRATVRRANTAIIEAVEADANRAGMGTTLAGLAVVDAAGSEHWLVFNVGDCRVYRIGNEGIEQLTTDHSEAEEMVLSGLMSREEARTYPRRNVVTRSLGTNPAPTLDAFLFPPEAGDRFIICSDGLTDELPDAEITELALAHDEPQALCEQLVARALASGGRDNVSVIVVKGRVAIVPAGVDDETVPRLPVEA